MRNLGRYLLSLAILAAAWQAAVSLFSLPPYLLPSPVSVARTLVSESRVFIEALGYTLGNAVAGAAIGITAGLATGLLLARSDRLRLVCEPYLVIFQSFPRESLFPLLVVWLGFGASTKVVSSATLAVFPVAVITMNAVLNTRQDYLNLIRSWGATTTEEFMRCRLPAAVPAILGGVQVAVPLALIGAVLGEFMGGAGGLGSIIISSGSNFRVDRIFAAVAVLACLGGASLVALKALQNAFFGRYFEQRWFSETDR